MRQLREQGEVNILLIPFILTVLLLVGALAFAGWAYNQRQDYKNNSDAKVAKAVDIAKLQEDSVKDKAFAEAEKSPLKGYSGPAAYGGLTIAYPKTWSGYVTTDSGSNNPLDGYFHPSVVPGVTMQGVAYALRVQVSTDNYATTVQNFDPYIKTGAVTSTPYAFPKVPSVVGVRFDGAIKPGMDNQGSLIIVPLRDKILKVWTESPDFRGDLNNSILPNITFAP